MTELFLRREVWADITSLIQPLFIEVPVPKQESERSCTCMLGESITTLSTILVLGFWNCSDSVAFPVLFLFCFFCSYYL